MTQEQMNILVPKKLREIEAQEQIVVLHAVESGSRAWDFASPDSDFDVRFIYLRRPEFYLRLEKTRDVLDYPIDDTWDLCGWDLQKALRLAHASNPSLFEWAASPIVYATTPEWQEAIAPLLRAYFNPRTNIFHYLSMSESHGRDILDHETFKVKRALYTLRSLLAAKWVLDNRTPPPMRFSELADAALKPEMRPVADELLRVKRDMPEAGMIPAIPQLERYIRDSLASLTDAASQLPKEEPADWVPLDRLFCDLLRRKA